MRINPQGRVPTLDLDGAVLIQSPAILEYLEEAHPEPPLLPRDPMARAKVRAVAAVIGCDIHPLNNSGTLAYLKARMGQDEAAANVWYAHWVVEGFRAIERLIEPGPFAFGDKPSSPTSISCRKSTTRAASPCRSTISRRSPRSIRPAPASRHFGPRLPSGSPTQFRGIALRRR